MMYYYNLHPRVEAIKCRVLTPACRASTIICRLHRNVTIACSLHASIVWSRLYTEETDLNITKLY